MKTTRWGLAIPLGSFLLSLGLVAWAYERSQVTYQMHPVSVVSVLLWCVAMFAQGTAIVIGPRIACFIFLLQFPFFLLSLGLDQFHWAILSWQFEVDPGARTVPGWSESCVIQWPRLASAAVMGLVFVALLLALKRQRNKKIPKHGAAGIGRSGLATTTPLVDSALGMKTALVIMEALIIGLVVVAAMLTQRNLDLRERLEDCEHFWNFTRICTPIILWLETERVRFGFYPSESQVQRRFPSLFRDFDVEAGYNSWNSDGDMRPDRGTNFSIGLMDGKSASQSWDSRRGTWEFWEL